MKQRTSEGFMRYPFDTLWPFLLSGYRDGAYGVDMPETANPVDLDWLEEHGYLETQWANHGLTVRDRVLTPAGKQFVNSITGQRILRVYYFENMEYVRDPNPDDSWDNGEQEAHGRFEFAEVVKPESTAKSSYYKDLVLPNDFRGTIQLVWCTYGTGSTFGHTSGLFDVGGWAVDNAGVGVIKAALKRNHDDYFGGVEQTYTESVTIS